ncbi:MAG: hypothetical protein IIT58_10980 [Treponema sp.]|nr:hypothetical protein [Treponema sp.]
MKRLSFIFALLLLFFGTVTPVFAAKNYSDEEVEINPKTGFPEITEKPFVTFEEGVSGAMVNRLIINEERSNFVWENYMIGAYCTMKTENLKPFDGIVRVSAYYPFKNTFNGMDQPSKQTILYAFDLFAGPTLHFDGWKYIQFNLAAGLHYMYQLTDAFHLNYLGIGAVGTIELPLANHWTILMNATFAVDYPNFGTNRYMQPYNYSWQYHADLGVRYSRRKSNKYSYMHSRKQLQ